MTTDSPATTASPSIEELQAAHASLSGFIEHLDEQDRDILAHCFAARDKLTEPCMGDYVLFPTGELERFSNDQRAGLQTSPSGSFYLSRSGYGSLSCGALNPSTPRDALRCTDIRLPGKFWFFHHSVAGPGRGVYFEIPCRVFTTSASYTGFLGTTFSCSHIQAMKEQLRTLMPAASPGKAQP
jgi:hypothetical protein